MGSISNRKFKHSVRVDLLDDFSVLVTHTMVWGHTKYEETNIVLNADGSPKTLRCMDFKGLKRICEKEMVGFHGPQRTETA